VKPGFDRIEPQSRSGYLTSFKARIWTLAAAALVTTAPPSWAQAYPGKPLRVIAGMAPGGGADANARRLAQSLTKIFKQNAVVENIAASGSRRVAEPRDQYGRGRSGISQADD